MTPEKLQQHIEWLNTELKRLTAEINKAKEERNFGREANMEGQRDALLRCLNKLKQKWLFFIAYG